MGRWLDRVSPHLDRLSAYATERFLDESSGTDLNAVVS
jgi:hypothetical protein